MHGLWKFDQDLEEKIPPRAAVEKAWSSTSSMAK
jgi:hypothetical protein